jgi:cobalt-zinc-cadmium efflux system protein
VLRVRRGSSLTEKVVSWHLIEDTLGWVAVLVGAGVMAIWDLPLLDPLLSIGISVFILVNVVRNLRGFFDVFLQRTPRGLDLPRFEAAALRIPGVHSLHDTHSWSIDGESHVLTTHLVMGRGSSRTEIVAAKDALARLLAGSGVRHVTVDVELEGEECVSDPGDLSSRA